MEGLTSRSIADAAGIVSAMQRLQLWVGGAFDARYSRGFFEFDI